MPKVTGFAAQVAEVEVDPNTGGVRVLNLTTAHDTGTVLNHLTLTGQIEGGIVTGFGFALMEENPMVDGKIATLTLGESKLPCIADVPPLKTVLVESPTGPTPFGGKAIAENPNVPTAAAIANAIADACGVRLFDLPLTAEKIYWALNQKRSHNVATQSQQTEVRIAPQRRRGRKVRKNVRITLQIDLSVPSNLGLARSTSVQFYGSPEIVSMVLPVEN